MIENYVGFGTIDRFDSNAAYYKIRRALITRHFYNFVITFSVPHIIRSDKPCPRQQFQWRETDWKEEDPPFYDLAIDVIRSRK